CNVECGAAELLSRSALELVGIVPEPAVGRCCWNGQIVAYVGDAVVALIPHAPAARPADVVAENIQAIDASSKHVNVAVAVNIGCGGVIQSGTRVRPRVAIEDAARPPVEDGEAGTRPVPQHLGGAVPVEIGCRDAARHAAWVGCLGPPQL